MVAAGLSACGGDGGAGGDRAPGAPLRVVAGFHPVAEAAARIGGDRVEVANLTPAGVEPHDLELTSRQVDRLQDADLVLYLGNGFQPAVEEIAERRDAGAVDLLDAVVDGDGGGDGEDGTDPHFWLDPRLMAEAAGEIARALAEASPADADLFEANETRYRDELAALDEELAAGLGSCERRTIVTAHAAFSYLAKRYGLTQLAIAGLSPEVEPDADRLAELADDIRDGGVTTVFYEELVSPAVARRLAGEAGVATAVLDPIEGLTDDQVAAGKDYAAVMRDNLAALRSALGCR